MASRILAIVGETGVGKTSLAMCLAQHFDGEIICADAWTVRKGMDIGTAKPSKEEQLSVPHHLLDLVEPDEYFSVSEFQRLANEAIKTIEQSEHIPIIVGGSGLYVDSVLYNYSFLTTESKFSREELNTLSVSKLNDRIQKEGIDTSNVDKQNKRRLIRLLETGGEKAKREHLRKGVKIIGLKTDNNALRESLTKRIEGMIKAGLEKEVRGLSIKYGWGCEALKGIGYLEWQDYFNGKISETEVKERILKNSMSLAKKQRTWFKRNQDIEWLDIPVNWLHLVDEVTTFINT